MTITFENDNDFIVYALEKIISFARTRQYIFLAQSVWWISSIIGLQSGLLTYIDYLQKGAEASFREPRQLNTNHRARVNSSSPRDIQGEFEPCPVHRHTSISEPSDMENSNTERQDKTLQECEELLQCSRRQRRIALLKSYRHNRGWSH